MGLLEETDVEVLGGAGQLLEKIIKALGILPPAPQSLRSTGLDRLLHSAPSLDTPPSGRLPGLTVPSLSVLLSGALTVARDWVLGTCCTLNCFSYTVFDFAYTET